MTKENIVEFKSGFVAVLGQPNAGKSTLINALVGKKVSIVSPKAQTTRNKILGILNKPDYQIIFIDTPGIHKGKTSLDSYMQSAIDSAAADVDCILYLIDGTKKFSDTDFNHVKKYGSLGIPFFVVVTKTDLTTYDKLYPQLARLNEAGGFDEVYCVSGVKKERLDDLLNGILSKLTDTTKYFDAEDFSDKDLKFNISETIREKMLWLLQEEIPHGTGVVIDTIDNKKNLCLIEATIYCERQNHKPIIIGKGGEKLKEIGVASRTAIEKMTGKTVNLSLFVKVVPGWQNKISALKDLGYSDK